MIEGLITVFGSRFFHGEFTRAIGAAHRVYWQVAGMSLVINLLMLAPSLYMLQTYDRVLAILNENTLLVLTLLLAGLLALEAALVMDMTVNTVSGVVKPGERVLDIAPADESLVVEAQLPPQFIDRVRPQLPADVHFEAYVSMAKRPMVKGVVETLSAACLWISSLACLTTRCVFASSRPNLHAYRTSSYFPVCSVQSPSRTESVLCLLTCCGHFSSGPKGRCLSIKATLNKSTALGAVAL